MTAIVLYRLPKHIYSNRNKSHGRKNEDLRIKYAKKGEVVSIVARHSNVLIVEGSTGNRFPMHVDHCSLIYHATTFI